MFIKFRFRIEKRNVIAINNININEINIEFIIKFIFL